MRPFLNRNIMTFYDLYEFWDNDPTSPTAPTDSRPGFKQMWQVSPFCQNWQGILEEDLERVYYRLLGRFFTMPFGMLDERQIHLSVFRIIRDFMPNVTARITLLNEIHDQSLDLLMTKQTRTATTTANGNSETADTGYENQSTAPNTAGTATEPIIDMLSAQRNRNLKNTANNTNNTNTTDNLTGDMNTAYQIKLNAIVDGLWDEFMARFDKLFVHLYSGVFDYVYRNDVTPTAPSPIQPSKANYLLVTEGELLVNEGPLEVDPEP